MHSVSCCLSYKVFCKSNKIRQVLILGSLLEGIVYHVGKIVVLGV